MALALFDLDNTLLGGDSDYEWGRFLVSQALVDAEHYERENQRFYDQYRAGRLDIQEFLRFSLAPLARYPREELNAWRERFLHEQLDPIILPAGRALLERHRQRGDTLAIITATNRFVTQPIAERLGVNNLLATEVQERDGRYTGLPSGVPCFREGKVTRLEQWLTELGGDLRDSWFYSDSHNDLPLLEKVDHPVAVDPDDQLTKLAHERGWPTISLR